MQKTDLIAELKRTKDIPGIKKLKVERAQVEKTQEQNLMSEINKAFSVTKFVDQVSILFYILFEEHARSNFQLKTFNNSKRFERLFNLPDILLHSFLFRKEHFYVTLYKKS